MSKQSRAILSIIQGSDRHLTADEILELCREQQLKMSLASVYRNLSAMAADGEIRRIAIGDEPDKYDKNTIPHGHAICRVCGKTVDIFLPQLAQDIGEMLGTEEFSYELNVHTVCEDCRGK